MGTFAKGTRKDVQDAIAAASEAFAGWGRRPWQDRVATMRRVADVISERQMEFSALLSMEVGKNRLEALGDVEETADLIRWSCDMMERNHGFDDVMGNLGDETVHTRSVLKPYGVWGVISPFNFPFALSGGPAGGALVAGNTVVYKPSSDAPLSGACLLQAMRDAGVPDGVFNMVMGPGETVGDELQTNPGVDGVIFTGSFEVGFGLYKNFARSYPKPIIVEMGGKNPAIVSRHADLDEAAEGIMRSAFGFSGQKCSANSRVYVERPVHDELVKRLVEKAEAITIGDPTDRRYWLGPVINRRAVERYEQAVSEARSDGRLAIGGERVTEHGLDLGFFVAPTVALDLPKDHRLFRDELFIPFTAVAPVDSIDEALRLSNDTNLGLTAGFYSEDQDRGRQVPRRDRGRRRLRQPAGRRDDRRLARHPAVRRLEGEHRDGEGRRRLLLRPAVHARAEPDDRRLTAGPPAAAPDDAAASRPDLAPLPHPVTRHRRGASRN